MKRSIQLMISLVALFMFAAFTESTAAETATMALDQSGYWAQVITRDATVRDRPNGRVLKTLKTGEWFHVYPTFKNSTWFLGYACPNGNRGCANRQSIAGYVLQSVLSGKAATDYPALPGNGGEAFKEKIDSPFGNGVRYTHAVYRSAPAIGTPALAFSAGDQERRICAREVWMRNDKLQPIQILRAGDRFIVERYTDGSKNDGNSRWAIGRAKNLRGRVLLSALCH
jgi:hypothetical protein